MKGKGILSFSTEKEVYKDIAQRLPDIDYDPDVKEATDITGAKKGRLEVLYLIGRRNFQTIYMCQCDCGNFCYRYKSEITASRKTKTCGCARRRCRVTHGATRNYLESKAYTSWRGKKQRGTTKLSYEEFAEEFYKEKEMV